MLTSYPGIYLHGINLNNWYPIYNISLNGSVMSPDYIALIFKEIGAVHHSLRDIPIEKLMSTELQAGVISPRAKIIRMASLIKNTGKVGIGVNNTRWLNNRKKEEILRLANIELEFERVRRRMTCDAASRLTCLWVAENTLSGQEHIRNMFSPSVYIATVVISKAIRVTKVDTDWFDRYCEEPNEKYIRQYWESKPYTSTPKWELLVEGAIRLTDQKQIEHIRKFGAQIT